MPPRFNFLAILMVPTFLSMASFAVTVLDGPISPVSHGVRDLSSRSASTCADPSLARTVFEGFDGPNVVHALNFHWAFIDTASRGAAGPPNPILQGPAFKAWPTQQPFTVPLFRLRTADNSDVIFMVGADAQTPPIVSGFGATVIIAWVYNTAVCGSVPLMSATLAAKSDHYYTTDPEEHAALLTADWTDSGVVAFVLPFPFL